MCGLWVAMRLCFECCDSRTKRGISPKTGGNSLERAMTLFASHVLPIYSCHVRFPFSELRSALVYADSRTSGSKPCSPVILVLKLSWALLFRPSS